MQIRDLDPEDRGYALKVWREAHKCSPGCSRVPWWAYRLQYGGVLAKIINDPSTLLLGAYREDGELLGWLAMMPGKRMATLHWVHMKSADSAGNPIQDRRDAALDLIAAAPLGRSFSYTLRGPKCKSGFSFRSTDEILVQALRSKGVFASLIPLAEWMK